MAVHLEFMDSFAAVGLVLILQAMPVTRLAGGPPEQGGPGQPAQRPMPAGLPAAQLEPGTLAAALDSPRRLSLTFAEPRPIGEVLRLVIAGTPFSLALDSDVAGDFRGELKHLTLREALTALLPPLGCEFELRGTVLRVIRHRTETREFDVSLLATQRGLRRVTGAPDAAVATLLTAEDTFETVGDGVRTLLSPSGTVHVDRRAGLVQATDYPERLDRIAQYLEALQLRSGRQVRLQARVFEVVLKADAGVIDWNAVRGRLGLSADGAGAGVAADPAALERALAEQGEIRVLSAPEVTALNNEPALIRAGGPGASSMTLTVVPQIASDGVVQMSISHKWQEQTDGELRATEADTATRVRSGDTVLLSGWLRPVIVEARAGSPALAGGAGTTAQAELVVLLRATVVTAGTR
jgi:type II secretory pathway component GspD/PulD (secretin)